MPQDSGSKQLQDAKSRELLFLKRKEELDMKERDIELKIAQTLDKERNTIRNEAAAGATEAMAKQVKLLTDQLTERTHQLDEAQHKELALLKRQHELKDKERELELKVVRTLDEEREKIKEAATTKAQEEFLLKVADKDKRLADMTKQIEELKRKSEQGSQQVQGEVLELELEEILRSAFRTDDIEPVPKGVKGADVIQKVRTRSGHYSGTILWEAKRTKAWSDSWIEKLKDDQRAMKADLAVIVSTVLPKDVRHIGNIDGVWVSDFPSVTGISTVLRESLAKLYQARSALAGKADKMESLYNYLTGNEFRQRMEAIIEPFITMKDDLDTEKRAMEKTWARRDKQIQKVIQSLSGMHGDLQGIVGASLPHIKLLELPADSSPSQ